MGVEALNGHCRLATKDYRTMTIKNHDQFLERREIADVLLRALERRHEVLDAIVDASDHAEAVRMVRELLDTTASCAEAVLDLQFQRLTKIERARIRDELADLDAVLEWTPMERPFSTGAHLRLRPITDSAADTDLFRRRCIERLNDHGAPWPVERVEKEFGDGRDRIDDESAVWLVAEDTTDVQPKRVGLVFAELEGHDVDVAVWISPESRKQGYGTAALKQSRVELAAYFPGTTLVIRVPTGKSAPP